MRIARAAAEIDPVAAICSINSALPGPIAGRRFASTRSVSPRYLPAGIRKEELLAVDLVGRDGVLSLAGDDPVDERLPHLAFHAQMPRGVHQDDAVLVEQPPVAFHQDRELAAVLEGQPGAAVGEDIRVHAGRRVQGWPHARPSLAIPRALLARDVDAGRLPQLELGEMRAAAVAAGNEGSASALDLLQCLQCVLAAGDMRRIRLRPDDHEIVVHHLIAPYAVTLGDELLLERSR